jgi:polyferredoxin
MARIGKPRGLIDYLALSDEARERAGEPPKPVWKHVLRPRTILYTTLWSLVGVGLVVALFVRPDISMTVAAVRNPVNVTLSDGTIRNTYDVRLRNKHGEERRFEMSLTGPNELRVSVEGTPYTSFLVPADTTQLTRIYVTAPPGSDAAESDRTDFRFWVEDLQSAERVYSDSTFFGAGRDD